MLLDFCQHFKTIYFSDIKIMLFLKQTIRIDNTVILTPRNEHVLECFIFCVYLNSWDFTVVRTIIFHLMLKEFFYIIVLYYHKMCGYFASMDNSVLDNCIKVFS